MLKRVLGSLLVLLAVPGAVVLTSHAPATSAPPQGGVALLTSVTAQDMGAFDRVTFTFQGGTPQVLQASYLTGPAVMNPSGLPVAPPVAGSTRLLVTMGNASGIDLSVDPPVTTYLGPKRFVTGLGTVVELVETEDFEATLQWVLGIAGGGAPATVRVEANPPRVVVDVAHISAVVATPAFTG